MRLAVASIFLLGEKIEPKLRKNQEIQAPQVVLIDENGRHLGITSREQALLVAHEKNLDLVEVGPNASPPVVKIVDWGKFKYQLEKKGKRGRVRGGTIKEIKLSLKIGSHDLATKARRAKEFLEQGNKVSVFLVLYGRERIYAEKGKKLLADFRDAIGGKFEEPIERINNRLTAMIVRKK